MERRPRGMQKLSIWLTYSKWLQINLQKPILSAEKQEISHLSYKKHKIQPSNLSNLTSKYIFTILINLCGLTVRVSPDSKSALSSQNR